MAKPNIKPPERTRRSSKSDPPLEADGSTTLSTPDTEELVQLNFRVPEAFKDEFKVQATLNKMKMREVLFEAFRLWKESRRAI